MPTPWRVERQNLTRLVDALDRRLLVAIGVASGAEARQLHHTLHELGARNEVPDYIGGFAVFVSGYLTAAGHGLPDLGYVLRSEIARQTDVIEQATWLAALDTASPALPIGVDIDTGYGGEPSAVLLTCRQVHKQGAQYVQIEDQAGVSKSCGHMAGARGTGKEIVSADEMITARLEPAVAYAAAQDDLLVMARTDALAREGFDAALERGLRYAAAGAKLVFIEAPESSEQLERIPRALAGSGALAVANMIEGSPKTPYRSPEQLHRLGYGIALYPIGSLLAARGAQERYYAHLGRGENAMPAAGEAPERSFDDFNRVIGRGQTETWNRLFRR
jgi:2-methylisocitrate lyase-like PEP mutase family enzyme